MNLKSDNRLEYCLAKLPAAPKVEVAACKYDNSIHRTWQCSLIEETADLWIFYGVFATAVQHPLLGHLLRGTQSLEYYWKNRWYNVFCFYEPDSTFRNYYCNVNQPPVLQAKLLTYIDLDIDVLVQPDLSYKISDYDEFCENSQKHCYPNDLILRAEESLREIIQLIETKQFPFQSEQLLP